MDVTTVAEQARAVKRGPGTRQHRLRRIRLLPAPVIAGFPRLTGAAAEWLVGMGVGPDSITLTGAAIAVTSGLAFGLGALRLGALLLLASGLLDTFDGAVARRAGSASRFGAFLDSTLDRIGEAALHAGIAIYFLTAVDQAAPKLAVLAVLGGLSGALLVSYTRARAEALGVECRLGFAQRAERIVGIGAPTLCFGAGPRGALLMALMLALAAASWATVLQRVVWVHRATEGDRV